jgi:hypothetical protein
LVLGAREERFAALAFDTHLAVRTTATAGITVFAFRTDAAIVFAIEVARAEPAIERVVQPASCLDLATFGSDAAAAVWLASTHEHLAVGAAAVAGFAGRAFNDALAAVREHAAFDRHPDRSELRNHIRAGRRLASELGLLRVIATPVTVPAEVAARTVRLGDAREDAVGGLKAAATEQGEAQGGGPDTSHRGPLWGGRGNPQRLAKGSRGFRSD